MVNKQNEKIRKRAHKRKSAEKIKWNSNIESKIKLHASFNQKLTRCFILYEHMCNLVGWFT